MARPKFTPMQNLCALALTHAAGADQYENRPLRFPLVCAAFQYGYNVYLADCEGRATPAEITAQIAGHVSDFPHLFAPLECWLTDNPGQFETAGRYMLALGDWLQGEPQAIPYAPLRYAVPPFVRLCLGEFWERVNG